MKLAFSGKKKIMLYIVSALLCGVFVFRFVFLGMKKNLDQVKRQIKVAEAELARSHGIEKIKAIVQADYDKFQLFLRASDMDQRQISEEFLKESEKLAKDSGVSVISLNPQEKAEEVKGMKVYKVDMRIEARPDQVMAFLYHIQESKFLVRLDKLVLSPKDENAVLLKGEVTIALTVI